MMVVSPSKLKIIWQEWITKPDYYTFGHGVHFHDNKIYNLKDNLVAFLDGFAWLHGFTDEVKIYCIKPNKITTARVLNSMKKCIEERVSRNKVPSGQITRRIKAIVNG